MLKSPETVKDTLLSRNEIPIIDVSFGKTINFIIHTRNSSRISYKDF